MKDIIKNFWSGQTIVLTQGRVFDYRCLKEKIGELEDSESKKIKEGYTVLHLPYNKNRLSAEVELVFDTQGQKDANIGKNFGSGATNQKKQK